jgi:hypothetical protein
MKYELLTPGSNIIIKPREFLNNLIDKPVIYIPLAWNFFDEIKNKINKITNSKNLYLKYFPKVSIEFM